MYFVLSIKSITRKKKKIHFDGEEIKVPFASPSNLHGARNTFEAMGRILSNGFILIGAIPVQFCQSSVMGAS